MTQASDSDSNSDLETNPYSAPSAVLEENYVSNINSLDFKSLKKLYLRSCNINALTFLVFVAAFITGIIFIPMAMEPELTSLSVIMCGLTLLYIIAGISLFKRTKLGRILGFIISTLSLVNFPIGTIIGAFCLVALGKAPELFGKERITHKKLKAEYKDMKKRMKS